MVKGNRTRNASKDSEIVHSSHSTPKTKKRKHKEAIATRLPSKVNKVARCQSKQTETIPEERDERNVILNDQPNTSDSTNNNATLGRQINNLGQIDISADLPVNNVTHPSNIRMGNEVNKTYQTRSNSANASKKLLHPCFQNVWNKEMRKERAARLCNSKLNLVSIPGIPCEPSVQTGDNSHSHSQFNSGDFLTHSVDNLDQVNDVMDNGVILAVHADEDQFGDSESEFEEDPPVLQPPQQQQMQAPQHAHTATATATSSTAPLANADLRTQIKNSLREDPMVKQIFGELVEEHLKTMNTGQSGFGKPTAPAPRQSKKQIEKLRLTTSPSESTIYAPAVNPASLAGEGVVDRISNFVENI